ncbi:hypothetical protein Q7C36_002238 [Tachysurus vachellii]|uniref:Uncharacterized protein n=1 Tax=Tachysurus vachellii TaxID=175792 RepID=A0AA88NSH1_TACVA|nr:hypothetical protein Q7C36_002238 [Tachysurus vachellii]
MAAPIVAKSVVADPPAAGPVVVASSISAPVVTVLPAVMAGHSGGDPYATVAKPTEDIAGGIQPAVNEKRMGEIASDPPLQVNQTEQR